MVKFMAKFENAVYVVEPKDSVFLPGGKVNRIQGVKAVFSGPAHIFDSEVQAKRWKWTPETKRQVEEHLITHDDFGRDIYPAPGEEIPEELRALIADRTPEEQKFLRCQKIFTDGEGIIDQCKKTAIFGTDLCEEHTGPGIVQGLGTTTRG